MNNKHMCICSGTHISSSTHIRTSIHAVWSRGYYTHCIALHSAKLSFEDQPQNTILWVGIDLYVIWKHYTNTCFSPTSLWQYVHWSLHEAGVAIIHRLWLSSGRCGEQRSHWCGELPTITGDEYSWWAPQPHTTPIQQLHMSGPKVII